MAYLGKTPSQAVRSRYYFTATGGETSLSGTDDNSNTLTFTDGNYVDVSLNGVALVAGTDYNTTTANTISGLAALTASDVVEIVVYDTFSVFGGNVNADLNFKDNAKAVFGAGSDLQIYHDGSNSFVVDNGTGGLQLRGSTFVALQGTNGENGVLVTENGSAQLRFNNSPKLETTGTGIDVTGNAVFGDNDKAVFGAGSDLQIYHDAGNSRIVDAGTGNLNLQADNNVNILNNAGTEFKAQFITDGAVNLFYDNSKKFETTATGIDVTGTITFDGGTTSADLNFGDNAKATFGASSDLQIYHDGSHSVISDQGTGNLNIQSNGTAVVIEGTSGANNIIAYADGATNLYYNGGSPKLATTSTGIDITGNAVFDDNGKAIFGAGNDLQIYHDGSTSFIDDAGTGNLVVKTNGGGILLLSGAENLAKFVSDGASELYYDNSKKLATTSGGIDVTGDVLTDTVTLDNGANDWQFSVDASNNLIISIAGTAKAKLDSSGNLTVVGDVTAFGTI